MCLACLPQGASRGAAQTVDPGQTPADLVVLSADPADLALLSEVGQGREMRLGDLAWLCSPATVDLYIDATLSKARLVVLRLPSFVEPLAYALDQLTARLPASGTALAVLPISGDGDLAALSTVTPEDQAALAGYFDEGGPENLTRFFDYTQAVIGGTPRPLPADPMPRAGLVWPGEGPCDLTTVQQMWRDGQPVVAFVLPRRMTHSAGLHPLGQMVKALARKGGNPLPVYVESLWDAGSEVALAEIFTATPPALILCAAPGSSPVLTGRNVPVLHCPISDATGEAWIDAERGLPPEEIAAHVVLPERAGHLVTRVIGYTDEAFFDEAAQCAIRTYRGLMDRVGAVVDLAAAWLDLARTARAERRVALVGDEGLEAVREALHAAGYGTGAAEPARVSLEDYTNWFDRLPWDAKEPVISRWGPPEADPAVSEGAFHLAAQRFGPIALAESPDLPTGPSGALTVPTHRVMALYLWLRQSFGAQALVHLGFPAAVALPGKALALSATCWPEILLGSLPHIALVGFEAEARLVRWRGQALALAAEPAGAIEAYAEALWLDPDRAARITDLPPLAMRGPDLSEAGVHRLVTALDGGFGAPEGMALPWPDPAAWAAAEARAEAMITQHLEREGDWPARLRLTADVLGETLSGGTTLAVALALRGQRPVWRDGGTVAFEPVPDLGRPPIEVDLTLGPGLARHLPGPVARLERIAKGHITVSHDSETGGLEPAI